MTDSSWERCYPESAYGEPNPYVATILAQDAARAVEVPAVPKPNVRPGLKASRMYAVNMPGHWSAALKIAAKSAGLSVPVLIQRWTVERLEAARDVKR
jgi:hypothetical protein